MTKLISCFLFLMLFACGKNSDQNLDSASDSKRSQDQSHSQSSGLKESKSSGKDPEPYPYTSYNGVGDTFERIKITSLYQQGFTGKGVIVAVSDDGVNCSDPELAGKCIPGGNIPYDAGSHGTGMAKIVAGLPNSSKFAGVAPQAQLLPKRVDNINQLQEAQNAGARVSTESYQAIPFRGLEEGAYRWNMLINQAAGIHIYVPPLPPVGSRGEEIVRVLVAGNKNGTGDDKAYAAEGSNQRLPLPRDKNALIVGAVNSKHELTALSRIASFSRDFYIVVPSTGPTSPAAPVVAGAVAVLIEKYPLLKAGQFVEAILATATRLADADNSGSGELTGCGLLNVEAADVYLSKIK
jgi:subtilisin family serine protease